MKTEIDKKSGFCFGVIEAISKAENELKKEERLYCLGDIVHNGAEVNRLTKLGMVTLTRSEFCQMKNCRVLVRAHGEPPETYDYARKNNITLIDATCPVVLQLQKRVKTSFRNVVNEKGQLVIFGKVGHAEIEGINGQIDNKAIIIQGREEIGKIDFTRPVELYSQTTMPIEEFNEIAELIKERALDNVKIQIRDTICRQVANRGPHLKEFAKKFDMVIFVAGIKSSNGTVLFDMCKSVNSKTYRVERPENIQTGWFTGATTVGICGATSTPRWLMENVAKWIEENIV